ncbi:MAG: ATP-binding protein [Planctomycetota bacterium]
MKTTAYLRNLATGQRLELPDDPLVLGRERAMGLYLDDEKVSRRHCQICRADDGFHVEDLGSLNGTFVNADKVQNRRLIHGDTLRVGDSTFLFFHEGTQSLLTEETAHVFEDLHPGSAGASASLPATAILESARNREDPFSKFYVYTQGLQGILDRDKLMQRSAELLCRLLEADRVAWCECIGTTDIDLRHSARRPDAPAEAGRRLSRNLILQAAQKQCSLLEKKVGLGYGSALVLPVVFHGEVPEVFYVARDAQQKPFSEDDLHIASAMVAQLSVSLGVVELARKLTDSVEFNDSIQNSLPSGLVIISTNGVIRRVNPSAAGIVGLPPHQMMGQPIGNFPGLHTLEGYLVETCLSGKPLERVETVIETESGQSVPILLTCTPIVDLRGAIIGAAANFRNMSDMKALGDQVRRGQQLAALGEMAAGIAHEIRNPLNSIRGFAELLGEQEGAGPSTAEYVGIIVSEVDRINRLVQDLLEMARETTFTTETEVAQALAQSLGKRARMQGETLGATMAVNVAVDDGLKVKVNVDKLTQVVDNLVRNACEAIEGGEGSVTFSAGESPHPDMPRGALKLAVSDTGCGMSADIVSKIFNPFFSTKDNGTGLGLSICEKILRQMECRITVESTEGQGSCFSVWIPLAESS